MACASYKIIQTNIPKIIQSMSPIRTIRTVSVKRFDTMRNRIIQRRAL